MSRLRDSAAVAIAPQDLVDVIWAHGSREDFALLDKISHIRARGPMLPRWFDNWMKSLTKDKPSSESKP